MFYDKKSTLSSWPLIIHNTDELNDYYKETVKSIENFTDYIVIYNPKEDYIIGYGQESVFYADKKTSLYYIKKQDIIEVETFKELLEAKLIIKSAKHTMTLHYVTSTYYLFDPLLDYVLDVEGISLLALEKQYPKPKALYIDSLCMYNYCSYAYRLGTSIRNYDYKYKNRREKWMPWKLHKEEWLTISNTKGTFECYSYKYIIRCYYKLKR